MRLIQSLAATLSDGILLFQGTDQITFANESARHLISHFGIVSDPLLTKTYFSSAVSDAIASLLAARHGETQELTSNIWPEGVEYGMPAVLTLVADSSEPEPVVIGVLHKVDPTDFAVGFTDRKLQLLELIGVMGTVAHKVDNQDDVIHVGLSEIGKCLGWELGHAYILQDSSDYLEPTKIWYEKTHDKYADFKDATRRSRFELGQGLPGQVWQSGKPIWISDIKTSNNFPRKDKVADLALTTAVGVPVLTWGRVVAVLEFFSDQREEEDHRLMELLTQVCAQIGHAYERNSAVRSADWMQRRFDVFLEATSDWFWVMGPDLRFTDEEIKDFPDKIDQPSGKARWELASAEDLEDVEKWHHHRAELEAHKPFRNFEYELENADGQKIWLTSTGIPLFGDDGEFQGYWGATSDVTEHKVMETQYLQARKMEAVGKLTGGVAHDFNNLLSVVIWNLDMALDELELDDLSREVIERAQGSAERGVDLTNRLLAFSRQQILHPAIVDVSATIIEFIGLLDRTLGETVEIKTELAEDIWLVEVDKSELENTILNLAINARDAFSGSGEIVIRTENMILQPDTVAHFPILEPTDFVHFSVSDNGCGMTSEVIFQAFEPFFTTKISGLGTGLGLSTIYGFVKQSRGFINIASEVGEGTTVDIYLPRHMSAVNSDDVPGLAATLSDEVPRGQGEKILVVEDDEDVRFSVAAILEGLGYDVESVSSGREGIDRFDSGDHFDVLLTDVVLGGKLSGRDVSRYVEEHYPDVVVLHMSGYAENHIVHDGVIEEGVQLLQKPFSKAQLAQEIRNLIEPG
jgi:signal transduction histidine kinase